jgi:hypothetical protein
MMVSPPANGGLCAVAHFEAKGDMFRIWFRTGSIHITDAGPVWTVEPPSFEGINTAQSGTARLPAAECHPGVRVRGEPPTQARNRAASPKHATPCRC